MENEAWPITIVSWGGAKLMRFADDHYELQGGTTQDWANALDWMESYMPDVAAQLKKRD